MAIVKLIDGRIIEHARLTSIRHVGDEGSREAIAHIDGHTYEVYNSIVDGFNDVWHEQMDYNTWKMLKGADKFVEGSIEQPHPDQNKLASLSDHALAELGLQREQVERWDQIIAQQEQEAREMSAFLDVERDSD